MCGFEPGCFVGWHGDMICVSLEKLDEFVLWNVYVQRNKVIVNNLIYSQRLRGDSISWHAAGRLPSRLSDGVI